MVLGAGYDKPVPLSIAPALLDACASVSPRFAVHRDGLPEACLSSNPLPLAKRSQIDELNLPAWPCLYGFSREPNFPPNARPVAHVELAKAVELQRESIRGQMVEQGGLQALDHGADDVLSGRTTPTC
jgi:hypothetical protein